MLLEAGPQEPWLPRSGDIRSARWKIPPSLRTFLLGYLHNEPELGQGGDGLVLTQSAPSLCHTPSQPFCQTSSIQLACDVSVHLDSIVYRNTGNFQSSMKTVSGPPLLTLLPPPRYLVYRRQNQRSKAGPGRFNAGSLAGT